MEEAAALLLRCMTVAPDTHVNELGASCAVSCLLGMLPHMLNLNRQLKKRKHCLTSRPATFVHPEVC